MKLFLLASAAMLLPTLASAQTSAVLPVTCNPNVPGDCIRATPVTNPDGSVIGASGGGTRTTAAGTSDTVAVPVQGVTGGVPQNTTVVTSALPTGAATQTTLAAVATSVAGPTPAGTNTIGNVLRSTYWNESSTPPAANGVVTGTVRDSGVPAMPSTANFFSCFAFANQAGGTLELRVSIDGTTYTTWQTQAVAASTSTVLTERVHSRYHGCRYTAGSTAPTVFGLDSQLGE